MELSLVLLTFHRLSLVLLRFHRAVTSSTVRFMELSLVYYNLLLINENIIKNS